MKPVVIAIGLLLAISAATRAQAPTAAGPVDLTGLWLLQDPGSGSWSGFLNNVPKPSLRPEIIAQNQEAAKRATETVFHDLDDHTGCAEGGTLTQMLASSPAISIVQSKNEVLVGQESVRARFIPIDGRGHQDIKSPGYEATGFGDAIGHWEGDTLVVDTIGFPTRMCGGRTPDLTTPGGGRARPTTHLVERFQVSPDRQMLTVTFTWEDPAVFLQPHTYSYQYKFLPGAEPVENQDSQRDVEYQQRLRSSVSTPPQK